MIHPRAKSALVFVGSFLLFGALGCGQAAQQSDPTRARETLLRALDSWKGGDAMEALKGAPSPVTIVDRQWQRGVRLLQYEVEPQAEPIGFDVQFAVKLSLQDKAGKKFKENAAFVVSTSPASVVVRAEAPG